MKKRRLFWIPVVIVLLAGGISGYVILRNKTSQQASASSVPLQTATVKNGNLIISASGVGTIIANQDVKDPNGMVTMLLSAQLSYLQAQENYESLVSSIPSELATAEQDLITAQATLKTAKSDRAVYNYPKCDEDETASARSAYELAQEQYDLNPTFEGTRVSRTPSANL